MNSRTTWLGLVVVAGWMMQATAQAAISWATTRAAAVAAAQGSGKLVLLLAGRDGCANTAYMKNDMCERASIRQAIDPHYVGWYCNVDSSTEWTTYAGGLGTFTLPMICVITPGDSMNYLDRTTGRQTDEAAFRARLLSHAGNAWDAGYQSLGGGWRRLAWFGDYVPMGSDGWIWHNRHGFFYVPASATPQNLWLYAQDMGWLYTSSTQYPFLYRANDRAWLWYNGSRNPRWFRNMATGAWERRP